MPEHFFLVKFVGSSALPDRYYTLAPARNVGTQHCVARLRQCAMAEEKGIEKPGLYFFDRWYRVEVSNHHSSPVGIRRDRYRVPDPIRRRDTNFSAVALLASPTQSKPNRLARRADNELVDRVLPAFSSVAGGLPV